MRHIQLFNVRFHILILLTGLACGCKDKSHIDEYMASRPDLAALTIPLDSSLKIYHSPNTTTPHPSASKYKIINFINTDCGNCYKRMEEWADFLSQHPLKADVIFITGGSVTDYFSKFFQKDRPFYIYTDANDAFVSNKKLAAYKLETFLTDAQGKVLLYGNPTNSPSIASYYETITEE